MAKVKRREVKGGDAIPGRCGARVKSKNGGYCSMHPVKGRTRCRMHGGTAARGMLSTQFKTGKYCDEMGGALAAAYKASINDPKLMDLTEGVAVLDAVVRRSIQRAAELDTPAFRSKANELHAELSAAVDAADPPKVKAAMKELGDHLARGGKEDRALDRISESVERYSKHATDAWKIALAKNNSIAAQDLALLLARIAGVVVEVAPKDVAAKILNKIDLIVSPVEQLGPRDVPDD